jgi:hypothetical protein
MFMYIYIRIYVYSFNIQMYINTKEWDLNMLDKKYEEGLKENLRLENILNEKINILGAMEVRDVYIYI